MTERELLKQARQLAGSIGSYRGLYQVPMHIALVLALMCLGPTGSATNCWEERNNGVGNVLLFTMVTLGIWWIWCRRRKLG